MNSLQERQIALDNRLNRRRPEREVVEPQSQSYMNSIPDLVIESLRNEEVQNCTICTEPLESNLTATHCGHLFHSSCIQTWIDNTNRSNPSCPICREVLSHTNTDDEERTGFTDGGDILAVLSMNVESIPEPAQRLLQSQNLQEFIRRFI